MIRDKGAQMIEAELNDKYSKMQPKQFFFIKILNKASVDPCNQEVLSYFIYRTLSPLERKTDKFR